MPRIPAASSPGRLADFAFRRRRAVVGAWVIGLIAAIGLLGPLAGDWAADYDPAGSGSKRAADLVGEAFPDRSTQSVDVVWQARGGAMAPAAARRVDRMLNGAQRLDGIGDGVTVRDARVARDGTIAVARLQLTKAPPEIPVKTGEALMSLAQRSEGDGLRIELGGQVIHNAQRGAISSEAVGLLVAALILMLTFGSFVAAGLPIGIALASLGISSVGIGLLAAVIDVPDWAPSMAAMLGIGVGIAYALLIVTRVRPGLAAGRAVRASTVAAIATAGRSVLIAGSTVVISLTGLFLMGRTYLYAVALASILTVLVVMAANVTLLPALVGFAARRLSRWGPAGMTAVGHGQGRRAGVWGRALKSRPWPAAIGGVVALAVLAVPAAELEPA